MTEDSIKNIEVDTSESVDAFHTKLKDGRVIKKTSRCFTYRKAEGSDGSEVRVDMSVKVYVVGASGALYNQEPKLNKAQKKQLKKARRSGQEVASGA